MQTTIPEPRKPHLVLRPPKGWAALELGELWHFRDLLYSLAARDVKLRYRQTALGVAWVVFQPLLLSGIFTVVFSMLGKMSTDQIPPFLFSFSGMLGYTVFNTTITKSSISLVANSQLVSKVYFPRLAIPISTMISSLLDFAISLVVVVILMAIYGFHPSWPILLMPAFLLMFLAMGIGLGLIAASLTVSYRDVQYIVPVLIQATFFVSPVGYALPADVSTKWFPIYMLGNPLASMVEAFRWSILGRGQVHWPYVLYAAALSGLFLFIGMVVFKRMEREFADII